MDRRDRFEELFRERLHNWECEPDSEQWKTLAGFLPLRPTRFSTRSIRRTAAIVTLLLLVGGGLLYDRLIPETTTEIVRNRIQPFIVDHIQIPQLTGTVTTDQIADSLLPVLTRKPIYTTGKTISTDKYKSQETKILPIVIASKALETDFSPVLIVRNTKTEPVKVRKASRKWHLGMGGGNFNIAGISSNSAGYPDYACNDHLQGNTPKPPLTKAGTSPISTRTLLSDLKPDKVKHSSPISFGISISAESKILFITAIILSKLFYNIGKSTICYFLQILRCKQHRTAAYTCTDSRRIKAFGCLVNIGRIFLFHAYR